MNVCLHDEHIVSGIVSGGNRKTNVQYQFKYCSKCLVLLEYNIEKYPSKVNE